jgi:phosphatidylglycerophosphate synthase
MHASASPFITSIKNADCYSTGERKWMTLTQQWRGRCLTPLLRALTRIGVSPDHITFASLVVGLTGCALWLVSPIATLTGLLLHVLLDGLDGPLARHQEVASPRGSFTDTMADQAVVTAVTVTLMFARLVSIPAGGGYIFLYAVVALFAMARNLLRRPYAWLIRPRFILYAWIPCELWLAAGTLNGLVWVCNALLALCALTGFLVIRRSLGSHR